MKYKVGDKVRIVSEWGEDCGQDLNGEMDKWLGKVMTIRTVGSKGGDYRMQEDKTEYYGFGWYWNENCIAGLACEKKIVITSDGEKTLARLCDGGKVVKTATAKCSPDDKFDFEVGATIAFNRLFEKCEKKEEPKYFNGKAVCVKPCYGFTIGKIYEFIDGQCRDDYDRMRPVGERLRGFLHYDILIPVIE